jgi:hypothetical protein
MTIGRGRIFVGRELSLWRLYVFGVGWNVFLCEGVGAGCMRDTAWCACAVVE